MGLAGAVDCRGGDVAQGGFDSDVLKEVDAEPPSEERTRLQVLKVSTEKVVAAEEVYFEGAGHDLGLGLRGGVGQRREGDQKGE